MHQTPRFLSARTPFVLQAPGFLSRRHVRHGGAGHLLQVDTPVEMSFLLRGVPLRARGAAAYTKLKLCATGNSAFDLARRVRLS